MRIWDLPVEVLCNKHLIAEHFELHVLWNVVTTGLGGWSHHPETRRWRDRLPALYQRHEAQVVEMTRRGFRHKSPLDLTGVEGETVQNEYLQPPAVQVELLRARCAACSDNLRGFTPPTPGAQDHE